MGTFGVVDDRERVEECLQFGEGVRGGLLVEPTFEGLLEAFDFPTRGGMVGSAVLLLDAETVEFGFERVAAAAAAGEAGCGDEAVISQR